MTEMTPDYSTVVENYARMILDGMDMKTLEQFAFDTLVDNLTKDFETVEDLIDEIRECYDDEVVEDLIKWSTLFTTPSGLFLEWLHLLHGMFFLQREIPNCSEHMINNVQKSNIVIQTASMQSNI